MDTFKEILGSIESRGFDATALEIFRIQATQCEPYARYIELLGVDPQTVDTLQKIPFLPIELFRTHRIYCGSGEPELTFNSSGTTGSETSIHYVASSQLYTESFRSGFQEFFAEISQYKLKTMLPNYRPGSSLLHMIADFQQTMTGQKLILWGVTFALLEAATSPTPPTLPADTIVIETGGMKGRGQEIGRSELYETLQKGLKVPKIYSEYGMCELLSQAYSTTPGIFRPSKTMKVCGRSLLNPLRPEKVGNVCGINIIDLCNRFSCSFLATGDQGIVHPDGHFEIHGRIQGEILRGCNML